MIRSLPLGIAAALLLALVALSAAPTNDADAASNLVVKAGEGEPGYNVNAFLPGTVTVMKGDSVTWEWGWWEPHIVAFLSGPPGEGEPPVSPPGTTWPNAAGVVYSGFVFGDIANPPTFGPIVFTTAGEYDYLCPIHPQMTAKIKVVESGDTDTQAELDARAAAEYAPRLASLKAVATALGAVGAKITPRADGTSLYELVVGGVNNQGDDVMQFFRPAANIKTGDTVKWVTTIEAPHTVTFNAPPGPPQGDPFEIPRTTGTTFDGTGFQHSGILFDIPEPGFYQSYELTFTKAGSFPYICILHAPQAMVGTVNVTAAATPTPTPTAAPQPPKTGTGAGGGGGTSPLWFLGIAGLFVAVTGGGVAWATRR